VGFVLYPAFGHAMPDTALKGLGFAVAGMLLTAVGDVCSARNASQGIHPLRANAFGFCVATLLIGGISLMQGQHLQFDFSVSYISALLYLTLIASCLAWLFYLKLVERIGAAASSYMVALFPAVGGMGSVAIGESEPSIYLLLGCLVSCVGAGIALGGADILRKAGQ
jgi:drug/metabolite transporter (DMT)-like permease